MPQGHIGRDGGEGCVANHRSEQEDFDALITAALSIGAECRLIAVFGVIEHGLIVDHLEDMFNALSPYC
jgi:hypothetical protein